MSQRAWISSLTPTRDAAASLIKTLDSYGIKATGEMWEDNLDQMSWMGQREEIMHPDTGMWIILTHIDLLKSKTVRYGLSLLILSVLATRGRAFPIINASSSPLDENSLPSVLKGLRSLSTTDASLGAKLVAFMHSKPAPSIPEYYVDVYANPHIGQWFEIGPQGEPWKGAMFAVDIGDITFHAAGPRGALPKKATMAYAVKGLKIQSGLREYTAWACQNELTVQDSYFIQVKGYPDSILFGPFTQEDEANVFILDLV